MRRGAFAYCLLGDTASLAAERFATSAVRVVMNYTISQLPRSLRLPLLLAVAIGGCGKADQDKLKENTRGISSTASVAARKDPAQRCASKATYELVKRELFRRAAITRGDDDPTFEPVVAGSTLQLEHTAVKASDDQLGSVTCTAAATLTLPDGMVAAGGRSALTADIGYVLQPAADQSGPVATITDAGALTIPLASIVQTRSAAAPDPRSENAVRSAGPTAEPPAAPIQDDRARAARSKPPRSASPSGHSSAPPSDEQAQVSRKAATPRTSGAWGQARVVQHGRLSTRINIERSSLAPSRRGETIVRIRYVGTLQGHSPVETITEEAVDCASGYHTQHSYLVRNAQGHVVARRGLQLRKRILPGSLLSGTLDSICRTGRSSF